MIPSSSVQEKPRSTFRPVPMDEYGEEKIDFSTSDAAAYIGVSVYMLRKWTKAGEGPTRLCWVNWHFYPRHQLDEWLQTADARAKGVA
jgi:hypothetical protein